MLLRLTSPSSDFFDGPLWWWGYLALPGIAALVGALNPHTRAALYGIALIAPQAVDLLLFVTVLSDPGEAEFWLVGLMFLFALCVLTACAAVLTSELTHGAASQQR